MQTSRLTTPLSRQTLHPPSQAQLAVVSRLASQCHQHSNPGRTDHLAEAIQQDQGRGGEYHSQLWFLGGAQPDVHQVDQLTAQVRQLCFNLDQLAVRVVELQEEVMVRHGLLLEVLVICLVFLLCRPGRRQNRGGGQRQLKLGGHHQGEKEKTNMKQKRRNTSIEVGCLPNG